MNVRLTDQEELNNFLTYGKWDLDQKQIERLKKDEEMKQRVREGETGPYGIGSTALHTG